MFPCSLRLLEEREISFMLVPAAQCPPMMMVTTGMWWQNTNPRSYHLSVQHTSLCQQGSHKVLPSGTVIRHIQKFSLTFSWSPDTLLMAKWVKRFWVEGRKA